MNPFEVGSSGDIVVFKVMKGRIKHVHENVPKKGIEPTPKFDCHLSKSVNRVTSLLSYRAFELTQQYFYEFAFEEIRPRPRHICPYAVVSFKFQDKEAAAAPMAAHRFNTLSSEGSRRKRYTVWSGPLVNKGQELFPISLRSSSRPFLPFKLPDRLEVSCGMTLEQVKRKLPPALFTRDTYRMSQEVMKCGMSCSLLEVVDGKGKASSGSLAALLHRLERDQMVLVKALFDRGFLFLLSSAQMSDSKERAGPREKNLQALFIFQGSRTVVKSSRRSDPEPQPAVLSSVEPFLPALHYALMKLRSNPGKDLSSGVERQANDYLSRMDSGTARPFVLPDYKPHVDDRAAPPPVPRPKFNMEAVLRSYVHNPANYMLPLTRVKDVMERTRSPAPAATQVPATVDYSPVSDWGGSDRGSDRAERSSEPGLANSNGAQRQPQVSKDQYDKNKMKQLLKLIQLHKKTLIKDPGQDRGGEGGAWDGSALKRNAEGAEGGGTNKHQRTDPLSNGESSQVIESMGIYDTDLRSRGNSSVNTDTQRLLKILLATLNKAVTGSPPVAPHRGGEGSTGSRPQPVSLFFLVCSSPEPKSEPDPEPSLEPPSDPRPDPRPEAVELTEPKTLVLVEENVSISLDTIVQQELHSLHSHIKHIMQTQHISYASQPSPRRPLRQCWLPNSSFSELVTPYFSPVSIQGHVEALGEMMDRLIPARPAPPEVTALSPPATPSHPSPPSSAQEPMKTGTEEGGEGAGVCSPSQISSSPETKTPTLESGRGLLTGSLISQLKPEVFSSLVEIFKDVTKNTVKFYIHSDDEGGGGPICQEIKGYLNSLGNSECRPQTFLENSGSLDKLLIIIRNEDIAAHVHKIPALVSLKKLPSVSFAGVDSLDDVKNHTYNELFVSGGLMVSDEFVLNPDLINQERLQGLLRFLEEQSTPEHPWQWKVHCKSQKKLKELGRLNTNAMTLLNLLTSYQKKHLVEFLPYHDCDAQLRQAPDLECLIKLQAQHTQQRHLIFLTERPFEMFLPFSRNGIIIASIDDVMTGFHSLIGSIKQNELPTPPSTEEEDMSLDSDDGETSTAADPPQTPQDVQKETALQPPPPDTEEVQPLLPDLKVTPESTPATSDFGALKSAISQFKASADHGGLSPGGFPVNPHQSFLCPSGGWLSYTGSSSYPASPCSGTQEQEYRPPATTPAAAPAGPLANLASLPLEVKPPPPPHLMMLGHTYSSDTGGGGSDRSDAAQTGYVTGISKNPTQQDRTHNGAGEGVWVTAGTSTGEAWLDLGGLSHTGDPVGGGGPQGGHGGRTRSNCTENLGASALLPTVVTRGGSVVGPKQPPPPVVGLGYGGMGSVPGPMDHGPTRGAMVPGSLGSYRGRGVLPGLWTGPGGGHDLGGGHSTGPCSWGYPAGRGGAQSYYSNFTNSHNYTPE
uniref:Uncharacterized protein n=1 Tax=Cynoglossus semilaevis TaxID=244447 RepID=A0A3P8X4P3_CYNSE